MLMAGLVVAITGVVWGVFWLFYLERGLVGVDGAGPRATPIGDAVEKAEERQVPSQK